MCGILLELHTLLRRQKRSEGVKFRRPMVKRLWPSRNPSRFLAISRANRKPVLDDLHRTGNGALTHGHGPVGPEIGQTRPLAGENRPETDSAFRPTQGRLKLRELDDFGGTTRRGDQAASTWGRRTQSIVASASCRNSSKISFLGRSLSGSALISAAPPEAERRCKTVEVHNQFRLDVGFGKNANLKPRAHPLRPCRQSGRYQRRAGDHPARRLQIHLRRSSKALRQAEGHLQRHHSPICSDRAAANSRQPYSTGLILCAGVRARKTHPRPCKGLRDCPAVLPTREVHWFLFMAVAGHGRWPRACLPKRG